MLQCIRYCCGLVVMLIALIGHTQKFESIDKRIQAADAIRIDQPEEAIKQGEELMLECQDNGYQHGVLMLRVLLAKAEKTAGRLDNSVKHVITALETELPKYPKDSVGIYRIAAEILDDIGAVDVAIQYMESVAQFQRENGEYTHQYFSYSDLAGLYLKVEDYPNAIKNYKYALETGKEAKDDKMEYSSYNNLGFTFYQQGELDSAHLYYHYGIEVLENKEKWNQNDSILYGFLRGNIATVHAKKGEWKLALPNMLVDYKLSYLLKQQHSQVHNGLELAKMYLSSGSTFEVGLLIDSLEGKLGNEFSLEQKAKLSRIKGTMYELEGESDKAIVYLKQFELFRDSIIEIQTSKDKLNTQLIGDFRLSHAESEIALEKSRVKNKEKEALAAEQETFQTRLILLFTVIIACLLIVVFWVVNKKRLDARKREVRIKEMKRKLAENEKLRLSQELELKNKDLTSLAMDISRKKEYTEEILNKLSQIKDPKDLNELREVIQYAKSQFVTDKNLATFQENLETINSAFFSRLETDFPNLTNYDKQLSGLIALGLTNKEIATLKNISPKGAKMARYRLRKKLNLSENVDVVGFLKNYL